MAIVPQAKYSLLSQDVPTVVVNGATGTGVGASYAFCVQGPVDGTKRNATFSVSGTFSVGTVTLQGSADGTNYSTYSTADSTIDVAANKFFTFTDLAPGLSYKLNVASLTGTSVTIAAVSS